MSAYKSKADWWIGKFLMLWCIVTLNCGAITTYYVEKADSDIAPLGVGSGNQGTVQIAFVGFIGVGVIGIILYKKLHITTEVIVMTAAFFAVCFIIGTKNEYVERVIPDEALRIQYYALIKVVVLLNQVFILLTWIWMKTFKNGEKVQLTQKQVILPGLILLIMQHAFTFLKLFL